MMKARVDESRIHRLDWLSIGRAMFWPIVVEAIFLVLLWLTYDDHGGAPHNPSSPLAIIVITVHLPVILLAMPITMGLGLHYPYDGVVVVLLQIVLLSYFLFVRLRLKKIKIRL